MERFQAAIIADIASSVGAQIAYQLAVSGIKVYGIVTKEVDTTVLKTALFSRNNSSQNAKYDYSCYLHYVLRDSHDGDDIKHVFSIVSKSHGFSQVLLVNYVSFEAEHLSTLTGIDADIWKPVIDAKLQRMETYAREAIATKHTCIVNINSIFGIGGLCAAWKEAVLSLSERLEKEISEAGLKIKVTIITEDSYTGDKFMQTSISTFLQYKSQIPFDIADAVDFVIKSYEWNGSSQTIVRREF